MHTMTGEMEETIIFFDELKTFSASDSIFFEIQKLF